MAWIVYTLVDGAISHWYPYPFVDVLTQGYAKVLGNGGLVLIVLAVVSALLRWGDHALPASGAASANSTDAR